MTAPRIHAVNPRRITRSNTYLEQAREVSTMFRQAKNWYDTKVRWTVTISSSDRLYDIARAWFLTSDIHVKPPRKLSAKLPRSRPSFMDDYGLGESPRTPLPPKVELLYDERGERVVTIDGHRITVNLTKPDIPDSLASGPNTSFAPPPETLSFHAHSQAGQQAVIELLDQLAAEQQEKRKPALHLLNSYGDWSRRDDLPERQLDSVVLAEGQMERIRDDIGAFISQEGEYARRGIPYHRGYLLHGPAGTGKTSIVRALAAHFALDLWYAPLGDLQKDSNLLALINQVRAGSILLLEDVDVFHATRKRDDDQTGLSMAGLLNALDGVATPHGLITFMTTNDLSVIDDAVIRPGRVDLTEQIGLPDKGQIGRLFKSWYGKPLSIQDIDAITFVGSTAEVTEIFKRNLNNDVAALKVLQTGN